MIKLVCMDFDGVIADCKRIHYEALNRALESVDGRFVISPEEHVSLYDGLSTGKKLAMLTQTKGFPTERAAEVAALKQHHTIEVMDRSLSYDARLDEILLALTQQGLTLYVASNAVRQTLEFGLRKLGVERHFNRVFSNQDVQCQKPHPEIYLRCMIAAGVRPSETLIVEDSRHGRDAAVESGAAVCGVDDPRDVTYEKIQESIQHAESNTPRVRWPGRDVNVLIPMAGSGSRFQRAGFDLPKPLIPIEGRPMIQMVVENLNIDANFIFIVQAEHYRRYNLGTLLPLIAPGCQIVQTDGVTEGAACTTLLAQHLIDSDKHLLIANSDQWIEWDSRDFMYRMVSTDVDGGILTFKATDSKWSYAQTDAAGYVTEVAEKRPISQDATCGVYYYRRGSDYVRYAQQMICHDVRVNGEFYVCPVYNEAIADGKRIRLFEVERMWGVGTPEDLETFLRR